MKNLINGYFDLIKSIIIPDSFKNRYNNNNSDKIMLTVIIRVIRDLVHRLIMHSGGLILIG